MIEGLADWALGGGRVTPTRAVIERFIANEQASGHFLHPGDRVEFASARLGTIRIDVAAP